MRIEDIQSAATHAANLKIAKKTLQALTRDGVPLTLSIPQKEGPALQLILTPGGLGNIREAAERDTREIIAYLENELAKLGVVTGVGTPS